MQLLPILDVVYLYSLILSEKKHVVICQNYEQSDCEVVFFFT